jgi:hypothetical protein
MRRRRARVPEFFNGPSRDMRRIEGEAAQRGAAMSDRKSRMREDESATNRSLGDIPRGGSFRSFGAIFGEVAARIVGEVAARIVGDGMAGRTLAACGGASRARSRRLVVDVAFVRGDGRTVRPIGEYQCSGAVLGEQAFEQRDDGLAILAGEVRHDAHHQSLRTTRGDEPGRRFQGALQSFGGVEGDGVGQDGSIRMTDVEQLLWIACLGTSGFLRGADLFLGTDSMRDASRTHPTKKQSSSMC